MQEQPIETFKEIARFCIKKQNKGKFDRLISILYRYKKLNEYLIDNPSPEIRNMIKKGLRYTSFQEMQSDLHDSETFNFIQNCKDVREFESTIKNINEQETIQKNFLLLINNHLQEYHYALNFLHVYVEKLIEKEENTPPE